MKTETWSPEHLPSYVSDGAEFLDHIDKDWYWKINLETLDLAMGDRCVLGQHHPSRVYDPDEYGLDELRDAALFGFTLGEGTWDLWNQLLTDLWRDEIDDRRWKSLGRRR